MNNSEVSNLVFISYSRIPVRIGIVEREVYSCYGSLSLTKIFLRMFRITVWVNHLLD